MKKLLLVFVFIICSCQTEKEKSISLEHVDSLSFRRNYFGHETLAGEKLNLFMNRNPEPLNISRDQKGSFDRILKKNGIIVNENLVLNKFDTLPDNFAYTFNHKKLAVSIRSLDYSEKLKTPGYILTFKDAKKVVAKDTLLFGFPPDVTFSKMDLDNNGTDEIYTVFRNYIINGDNFDVGIYELKETSKK
jgi:hypothetical protein